MQVYIVLAVVLGVVLFLLTRKKSLPPIQTVGSIYEKEVTDASFEQFVLQTSKNKPVMVDFYAKWCAPCLYLTPLLAEMARDYDGAFLLAKIDTDANPRLKKQFNVAAIPTVMLFKDGEPVERFSGGKMEHSIRYKLAEHDIMQPQAEVDA